MEYDDFNYIILESLFFSPYLVFHRYVMILILSYNFTVPCVPGHALDQTKGCLPCPEAAWSEGGLEEACNPCPAGKTVGVGKGVSEPSCIWREYDRNYHNTNIFP